MYDFIDKGGRHVALRPELTASVCRAFVQHRPPTPWKVWYAGPQLPLREAPARPLPPVRPGRHRGARRRRPVPRRRGHRPRLALLSPPSACARSRCCSTRSASRPTAPATSTRCAQHFGAHGNALSAESRATLERNPLASPRLQARRRTPTIVAAAPQLSRVLRARSRRSTSPPFSAGLDALGIPFTVDAQARARARLLPRTTFEFAGGTLDAAQNALGGGGRYDGLVEALGGPPTPGIGFAFGLDRTLLACDDEGVFAGDRSPRRRVRRRHHRWPRGSALTDELVAPGSRPTAPTTTAA